MVLLLDRDGGGGGGGSGTFLLFFLFESFTFFMCDEFFWFCDYYLLC